MKHSITGRMQRGFFDFGLAIAILAGGTTAGIVKTNLHESEMLEQTQVIEKQSEQNLSSIEHGQANVIADEVD